MSQRKRQFCFQNSSPLEQPYTIEGAFLREGWQQQAQQDGQIQSVSQRRCEHFNEQTNDIGMQLRLALHQLIDYGGHPDVYQDFPTTTKVDRIRTCTDFFRIPLENVKFEFSCPSVALESGPGPTSVAQCTNPVGAPPQKLELYTKFAIAQLKLRCIVLQRTYSQARRSGFQSPSPS